MCDFDITSFREKSNTKNKTDTSKEESAYAIFLKKRKQLGLDDSDSDEDDDNDKDESKDCDIKNKKQKQKQKQKQQQYVAKSSFQTTKETDQQALILEQIKSMLGGNKQETDDKKQACQTSSHEYTKSPILVADDPICLESNDDDDNMNTKPANQQHTKPAYTVSLDIEDLDPELASLAGTDISPSSNQLDVSFKPEIVPQKIQIKVCYVSLIETTDPVVQGVINALAKPVKIITLDNSRFDTLLKEYCKKKRLLMQDMVLVYDNVPVVLRATPSSLSMSTESINKMEVYKKEDFEKKMKMEQEIRSARLSQLNELTTENDQDDNFDDDDINYSSNTTTQEDLLHIKLRGKDNKDIGLRVKQTTTVDSIIKEYHRIMKLDASVLNKIQLSFEGETLTGSMTITDTDLEDEDMVSVIIHS